MIAGLALASLLCTVVVTALLLVLGLPVVLCLLALPVEMLGFWCAFALRQGAR